MEAKEILVERYGQGYEVLVGQCVPQASRLFNILSKADVKDFWKSDQSQKGIGLFPNQDVDFRMFVSPGIYSPIEQKFIPAFRFAIREETSWKVLCMPWKARRLIDYNFHDVYGERFALFPIKDYRTNEIPERNCGDDDLEGC